MIMKVKEVIITLISMLYMLVRNFSISLTLDYVKKIEEDNVYEDAQVDAIAEKYNQIYIHVSKSIKDIQKIWDKPKCSSIIKNSAIMATNIATLMLSQTRAHQSYTQCVSALSLISFYRFAPGDRVCTLNGANCVVSHGLSSPSLKQQSSFDGCCFFCFLNFHPLNYIEVNMFIVCVAACPTGIAHTYMAAEALELLGKEYGLEIKIETQGSIG